MTSLSAALLLAAGACGNPAMPSPPPATATATATLPRPTPGSGAAAGSAGSPDSAAAAQRRRAAQRLLDAHLVAWRAGDRAGWVTLADPSMRAQRAAAYDRMTSIGVEDLQLVAHAEVPEPDIAHPTAASSWRVRATFSYRIGHFDTRPRTFSRHLVIQTTTQDAASPRLVGDEPADRPQPWDLDDLVAVRRGDVLVLGVGGPEHLEDLVATAERARSRVRAVWGSAAPLLCIAPADTRSAAALLGSTPDTLTGVAAVTDGPLETGQPAGADRVVILPLPWRSLSATGRDVVLTHEALHVTVRAATATPLPMWLSEGFAEYVAYRDVALDEATIAAAALEHARESGAPPDLPTALDFEVTTGSPDVAYGLSLLAVRVLAERHGERVVVQLVRALGSPSTASSTADHDGDPDAQEPRLEAVLRTELGTTRNRLVEHWRARVSALAGAR